jgi:hypothetical protein
MEEAPDPQMEAVADKRQPKFAGGGPLSDDDVTEAVRGTAEELREAPVQT